MKRSPHIQRVVDRMAPGALCRDGFLGADRRPLEDILDTDNSTVVGLGLTHGQIADRLAEVVGAAVAGLGTPVRVGRGLSAAWHEARGRIPCPFPGDGTFPKGQVELTDETSGRTFLFTPLSVHLIARHGFYQGRGSRYRIDPDTLAALLRLGT